MALESTRVYSNPVFHTLMEFGGFEVGKCNAAHVKNVPGRKTAAADSRWLCVLLECGLQRGLFIPAAQVTWARDGERSRELPMSTPGIASGGAAVILPEMGQDMSFFPTTDQLREDPERYKDKLVAG